MPLSLARANAYHLATTLMICVVLIQTDSGYGVMPASEFDGPAESIVHEYDPWG